MTTCDVITKYPVSVCEPIHAIRYIGFRVKHIFTQIGGWGLSTANSATVNQGRIALAMISLPSILSRSVSPEPGQAKSMLDRISWTYDNTASRMGRQSRSCTLRTDSILMATVPNQIIIWRTTSSLTWLVY